MKQHIIKWLCAIIMLGYLSPLREVSAQTNYNVPITFSVTSTGINRFIASQWSSLPNNATWSGEYQGLTYSIHLNRPAILLSTNTIRITLELVINSTVYNGTATLTPTLTVPSATISASNVIAQYTNLHDQIIAAAQLVDPRLRYVIEQALSPIDWVMYQGRILDQSTYRWTEISDISWQGLPTLTVNVSSNEVNFTVTPTITAKAPEYTFQYNRPANQEFGIRVHSNNLFQVKYAKCWNSLGQQIANSEQDATAVYDPATGKYTATLSVTAPNPIANNFSELYYKLKLRRQNNETLWYLLSRNSILGTFSTWRWFPVPSGVVAIRGE